MLSLSKSCSKAVSPASVLEILFSSFLTLIGVTDFEGASSIITSGSFFNELSFNCDSEFPLFFGIAPIIFNMRMIIL